MQAEIKRRRKYQVSRNKRKNSRKALRERSSREINSRVLRILHSKLLFLRPLNSKGPNSQVLRTLHSKVPSNRISSQPIQELNRRRHRGLKERQATSRNDLRDYFTFLLFFFSKALNFIINP